MVDSRPIRSGTAPEDSPLKECVMRWRRAPRGGAVVVERPAKSPAFRWLFAFIVIAALGVIIYLLVK